VLNATFGNISAISLQPVLVVEEAGIRITEQLIQAYHKYGMGPLPAL
jgi:hypothetical protein